MIYLIVTFCLLHNPDYCQTARVETDGNQLECLLEAQTIIGQLASFDEWRGYHVTGWRCELGMPI